MSEFKLNQEMRFKMWVAWKLPKWLVYYAAIRLLAYATSGQYSGQLVPDLTLSEALRRWELCSH